MRMSRGKLRAIIREALLFENNPHLDEEEESTASTVIARLIHILKDRPWPFTKTWYTDQGDNWKVIRTAGRSFTLDDLDKAIHVIDLFDDGKIEGEDIHAAIENAVDPTGPLNLSDNEIVDGDLDDAVIAALNTISDGYQEEPRPDYDEMTRDQINNMIRNR